MATSSVTTIAAAPSMLVHFARECAVILLISYPTLLFLIGVYPGLHFLSGVSIVFLFALTSASTVVISALLSLFLLMFRQNGISPEEQVAALGFVDQKSTLSSYERAACDVKLPVDGAV
ncbi:hypothetical protein CYLTODRAFT_426963 [Cylindrobasidium torrendii FP15055 ss-10]|uniref:Uncharacterized protein n=1 Tax=Cylindrobasidium torrendii FP15055 ss-10 TaxID=1314674 RepID=A0A0D7AVH9_9AGAR|nr:hypothetical protein CYLTODRAFT_426963 [Cylindrobasidium torrendii FP15055 ss-10]